MRIIADPQKQLDEGRERRNRAMQRARGAKAAGKPYADMVRFARLCNHILCTYRASLAGRRFLRPAGVKVALRQERQLARRLPAPGTSPACRTPLTRQARSRARPAKSGGRCERKDNLSCAPEVPRLHQAEKAARSAAEDQCPTRPVSRDVRFDPYPGHLIRIVRPLQRRGGL